MNRRLQQEESPGAEYAPGQLTKHFIREAINVKKLSVLAEHFKEVLEILINGLRENSHFTSYKNRHMKELVCNLGRYTEDLEQATLDVFRATHYADIEGVDDETGITLDTLYGISLDARSNLTLLHMFAKRQLPAYLKTKTAEELSDHLLKRHRETVKDLNNDFITMHDNEMRLSDNAEFN